MDKTPAIETLFQLLRTRDIPGTPEQLERLCIRLRELSVLNGPEWVYRHRERLLSQWTAATGHTP